MLNDKFSIIKHKIMRYLKKFQKFLKNQELRIYGSVAIVVILVSVFVISICHSYEQANISFKNKNYQLAYRNISYVNVFAPFYKNTRKEYSKISFYYYLYTANDYVKSNDYATAESFLNKAKNTKFAKEYNLVRIVDGFIYFIWANKYNDMGNEYFEQNNYEKALESFNNAVKFLNLTREKQKGSFMSISLDNGVYKSINDKILKTKNAILKRNMYIKELHSHMHIDIDRFEGTRHITDYDYAPFMEDIIGLSIVQYKQDNTPRLLFDVYHFGQRLEVERIIFIIDGKVREIYVSQKYDLVKNTYNLEKYMIYVDQQLLKDLINSKKLEMRLKGKYGKFDRIITDREKMALKRTLDYYNIVEKDGNASKILQSVNDYKPEYRIKKVNILNKYLDDAQILQSEFMYAPKWYLYQLYRFQKMTPQERILCLRDEGDNAGYQFPEILADFADSNQVYRIAEGYCIKPTLVGVESNKYNAMQKTVCTGNEVGIYKLPYKFCPFFKEKDQNGVYYVSYDLTNLWKEFDKKGISTIENEINNEIENYSKQYLY